MKTINLIIGALLLSSAAPAETLKGRISFTAETNVKMFRFKAETSDFLARIARTGSDLSSLEIRIPVASLKTGMNLRDKHTNERIFTASDGSLPDVVFKAEKASCTGSEAERKCEVPGELSFRGVEKPAVVSLTLKDGKELEGGTLVDVLDFGVKPEHLTWTTVRVNSKVPVSFEGELN